MIEGLLAPCLWQCAICCTIAASVIASDSSIARDIADASAIASDHSIAIGIVIASASIARSTMVLLVLDSDTFNACGSHDNAPSLLLMIILIILMIVLMFSVF